MPCRPRVVGSATIDLARLTDVPSMLSFALSQVCTLEGDIQGGYQRRNDSVVYLDPSDVRLPTDARAELAKTVFALKASDRREMVGRCIVTVLDHIRDDAEPNVSAPHATFLTLTTKRLGSWQRAFALRGVCSCRKEMRAGVGGGGAEEGVEVVAGYLRGMSQLADVFHREL
ncbi:hypothetical protein V8D89_006724 [Ganoderma adspersum]